MVVSWVDDALKYAAPIMRHHLNWDEEKTRRVIVDSYQIDEAESNRISAIPQRSEEWHRIRGGWVDNDKDIFRGSLVSSSVAGDILGHKGVFPKKIREDGSDDLYGFYINTQRGTAAEPFIREEFKVVLKEHLGHHILVNIEEVGIQVPTKLPWMAASPDGLLHLFDTIKKKYYNGGLEMKNIGSPDNPVYKFIKHDYYDQVILAMHILQLRGYKGLDEYWFVCHSKDVFSVEKFLFNEKYWNEQMAILTRWYWQCYWPTLVLFHKSVLKFDNECKDGIVQTGNYTKDYKSIVDWAILHDIEDYLIKAKQLNDVKRIMSDIDWYIEMENTDLVS